MARRCVLVVGSSQYLLVSSFPLRCSGKRQKSAPIRRFIAIRLLGPINDPGRPVVGLTFSASRFPSHYQRLLSHLCGMSSSSSSAFSSSSFARSATSAFSPVLRARAPLLRPRAVSPPPRPAPVSPRGPRAAAQQAKSRVRAHAIEEEHSFSDDGDEDASSSADESGSFVRRGARRQRRSVSPAPEKKLHPCRYDDVSDEELIFIMNAIYNTNKPAAEASGSGNDDDDDCVIVRTIPAYVEQPDDCVIIAVVPAPAPAPAPVSAPSPVVEVGSAQLALPLFLEPELERVILEQKQQPLPVIVPDIVDNEDVLSLLSFAQESMMDWEVSNPIDIDYEMSAYAFAYNPLPSISDFVAPIETVLYSYGGSSSSFDDPALASLYSQIATVSE